jgi:hypothetical protein
MVDWLFACRVLGVDGGEIVPQLSGHPAKSLGSGSGHYPPEDALTAHAVSLLHE